MTQFHISWEAPEFSYHAKGVGWYWMSMIVAVLLIGAAIWEKNFLFGFFIVVAEILLLSWANQKPRIVSFDLDERGIEIDKLKFIAHAELESFSLDAEYDPEWPDIYFNFKSKIKPPLRIKAPRDRYNEIEKALKSMLAEVEHERSLFEAVERIIGF